MVPQSFPSRPRRLTRLFALSPLVLLLLGFLVDRPALGPPPHGDKPMFPVRVMLDLSDLPASGEKAHVLASVTAWAPGETVEWTLELPDGLTLLAGPDRWSGMLERGETRQFELTVGLPDGRPHELHARARLPERPGATAGAALTLDAGPSDAAPATLEAGIGQDYLQYRGLVLPRDDAPARPAEPGR